MNNGSKATQFSSVILDITPFKVNGPQSFNIQYVRAWGSWWFNKVIIDVEMWHLWLLSGIVHPLWQMQTEWTFLHPDIYGFFHMKLAVAMQWHYVIICLTGHMLCAYDLSSQLCSPTNLFQQKPQKMSVLPVKFNGLFSYYIACRQHTWICYSHRSHCRNVQLMPEMWSVLIYTC